MRSSSCPQEQKKSWPWPWINTWFRFALILFKSRNLVSFFSRKSLKLLPPDVLLQRSPDPLAGFQGPTSKEVNEGKREKIGKGREKGKDGERGGRGKLTPEGFCLALSLHSPEIFGPRLLWPNGWMDQYATWYGGRPRPRPHCVRWGPSSHKRDTTPISAHVCCGQTSRLTN